MRAVFFVAFLLATVACANALIKPHCKCITDPCPCEDPEVPRKLVKRAALGGSDPCQNDEDCPAGTCFDGICQF